MIGTLVVDEWDVSILYSKGLGCWAHHPVPLSCIKCYTPVLHFTYQWPLYELYTMHYMTQMCGSIKQALIHQFTSEPSLCVCFFADFCRETKDIFVFELPKAQLRTVSRYKNGRIIIIIIIDVILMKYCCYFPLQCTL